MTVQLAPWADSSAQFYGGQSGLAQPMSRIEKIIIHTAETGGWPSYNSGKDAPHLSWAYDVSSASRSARQHFFFTQISRSLVNAPGGVETNTDGCIQIELLGTCDPDFRGGGKGLYWPGAPDQALALLAQDIAWLCDNLGISRVFAPVWLPYPASYGDTSARLSGPAFDAYRGILGHSHVPENVHGDPGALNVARIQQLMPTSAAGSAVRDYTTQEDDLPYTEDQLINAVSKGVYAQLNWPAFVDPSNGQAISAYGLIKKAAGAEEVVVDPSKLAAALLPLILPQITSAIAEAGVTATAEEAQKVADVLAARLAA